PEDIVEAARVAVTVAVPLDRCYTVRTESDANMELPMRQALAPRDARLWTRGDRYFLDTTSPDGNRHFLRGRDAQGRFWVTPGPRVGLLFNPDEVVEPVTAVGELYSMNLDTLLGDLLVNFQLHRAGSNGAN